MRGTWVSAAGAIGLPAPREDADAPAIFHAICHTLVDGRVTPEPACSAGDRETAVLRVQYVLAGRHGLRALLAPAELGEAGDVLAERTSRSVRGALVGLRRADREPWAPALHDALAATAALAGIQPPARHPTGMPLGESGGSCATCAWRGISRDRIVCQQAEGVVDDAWPACERYEPALDCQDCGACCREAFHMVRVEPDDPAIRRLPLLVIAEGDRFELRREGDRCAALTGGDGERYACGVYEDRPTTCRSFTAGTSSCLLARQRVGMSR